MLRDFCIGQGEWPQAIPRIVADSRRHFARWPTTREEVTNEGIYLVSAVLLAATAIPASAAEISDGKVKIGILNDQSGVYADFGGKWSVEAARMAVEDFGGKVQGAPIEVISADHQNKPDIASNIARQWYDTEQVDSIMELTTSSVALAVQGISKDKKKIDIVTGAATTDLTGKQCSPYGFHWAYDTHSQAVGTGGALVKQGGDSWFFVTVDYAFGYSLKEQTAKFVEGHYPLGATDYSSFLLRRNRRVPRSSGWRTQASTLPIPSSRRPNSASCRAVSAWRRCSSRWPRCMGSAFRRRKAWC